MRPARLRGQKDERGAVGRTSRDLPRFEAHSRARTASGGPPCARVLCNKSKETTCPHCYTPSLGISSVSPLAARSCGRCTVAELCVNATTGDIYAARDDGLEWGGEEYLPTFLVVRVECDADAAQQYVSQRLDVSAAVTADVLTMVENSQWAVPTIDAAHIAPAEGV